MADVVCVVDSKPDEITFTWSQGPDAFPPYSLEGQIRDVFREEVETLRARLRDLVATHLEWLNAPEGERPDAEVKKAALALAQAGHTARRRIFWPKDAK